MTVYRIPVESAFSFQKPITNVLMAPPETPAKGDRYIVAADATGDWTGHDNAIAWYDGAAWQFDAPVDGWFSFNLEAAVFLLFDGSDWTEQPTAADYNALSTSLGGKITGVNTAKITVSDTEPTNPAINDLWVDTSGA